MFNGKNKAITFSYDDGITQDIRLIEIFNKYNLKATFNLNSELLGIESTVVCDGVCVEHRKNNPEDVNIFMKNTKLLFIHLLTRILLQ